MAAKTEFVAKKNYVPGCNEKGRRSGQHEAPEVTNEMFTLNEHFKKACAAVKVQPTKRAASKFRRGFGLPFQVSGAAPVVEGFHVKADDAPPTAGPLSRFMDHLASASSDG